MVARRSACRLCLSSSHSHLPRLQCPHGREQIGQTFQHDKTWKVGGCVSLRSWRPRGLLDWAARRKSPVALLDFRYQRGRRGSFRLYCRRPFRAPLALTETANDGLGVGDLAGYRWDYCLVPAALVTLPSNTQ